MSLRPYAFVSARQLCAPVSSVDQLDTSRRAIFTQFKGQTIVHRPPDLALDDDDLLAPGQTGLAPINLRDHRVTSEDTFIATLPGAVVEKFIRQPVSANTFTVLVGDDLALAEAFHGRQSSDTITRLMGETSPLTAAPDIHVPVREDGPVEAEVGEPCLLMASRFVHHNYYHWTFEGLSRLWALKVLPDGDRLPLVFPTAELRPFHTDLLRAMGLRNPIIALKRRLTRFERLIFPSFLDGATVTPRQVAWLRQTLLGAFPAAAKGGPRRLYVSRRDAGARRVGNEDAVMTFLSRHGFEMVVPGQLDLAGQIRAFASAEIVIAPHGAGNTNTILCPPGATFLELVPTGNASALYWMTANVTGLRYGRLVCPEDAGGVEMTVDIPRLEALLMMALHG